MDEQKIAQNVQALKTRLRGRGGRRVNGRGGALRFDSGSGRDSHPGSEFVSLFIFLLSNVFRAAYPIAPMPLPLLLRKKKPKLVASGATKSLLKATWLLWIIVQTGLMEIIPLQLLRLTCLLS
jgi:hypothetical protein